jgi:hypothetical protein
MSIQSTVYRHAVCIAAILSSFAITEGVKADAFRAEGRVTSWVTDNVLLDQSQEWDLVLRPSAEIALDFAQIYSVGYSGELNAYTQHGELSSHWHQLYLLLNPAWGEEGEHEFALELSVETLRNQSEYSANNLVRPAVLARLAMEPENWFRFSLVSKVAYGWCYDDRPSNALDVWAIGEVSFTLPSRSTLSPRVAYGYRYYPEQDRAVTTDDRDYQIELGTHFSQALWNNAGLQLEYGYIFALGESGLLLRKLTQEQFSYLDQGFLYSGSQAMIGVKQRLGESWTLDVAARFKEYSFAGWQVLDTTGVPTGEDRRDLRLTPAIGMSYLWTAERGEEDGTSAQVQVSLEYSFTKQWSNSDWFDASAHTVSVNVWGSI